MINPAAERSEIPRNIRERNLHFYSDLQINRRATSCWLRNSGAMQGSQLPRRFGRVTHQQLSERVR
jgi:hypothetical protein